MESPYATSYYYIYMNVIYILIYILSRTVSKLSCSIS